MTRFLVLLGQRLRRDRLQLTLWIVGTALPDTHDLVIDEGRVRFTVDSDRVADVLPDLGRLGVQGLTVAPPSLEDLFLRHYGDELAPVAEEARA